MTSAVGTFATSSHVRFMVAIGGKADFLKKLKPPLRLRGRCGRSVVARLVEMGKPSALRLLLAAPYPACAPLLNRH
jgi:hypothetical protein